MDKVYIVMEQEYDDGKPVCSYAKAFSNKKSARAHINEDVEMTMGEWGAECEDVARRDIGNFNETSIEFENHKVVYSVICSDVEGE